MTHRSPIQSVINTRYLTAQPTAAQLRAAEEEHHFMREVVRAAQDFISGDADQSKLVAALEELRLFEEQK